MSEKGGKAEEKRDRRVEFLQDFTLKSMRLKIDKWNKIVVHDEQRQYLQVIPDKCLLGQYESHPQIRCFKDCSENFAQAFLDKEEPQSMVISQNTAGHLIIHTDWPSALKNKGVFFVKREKQPVPLDEVSLDHNWLATAHPQDFDLTEFITYGDIYPNALDHFCAWVEEVSEWKNKETLSQLSSFPRQVLVPIFRNEANMLKYPHCVSYDIKKQVQSLVFTP